jgi:hypothetical protein
MYKRYSSMAGDITMDAPRRLLAQTMAQYKKDVYSYRWDVPALNETSNIGVSHFAEVRGQTHARASTEAQHQTRKIRVETNPIFLENRFPLFSQIPFKTSRG